MQKIRTVHLHDGDTDNWRPLQDRNGRDLTYYETCT
uniref:Uncharacterized protein n=1 Tax=Bracon brevicornis TaxID=1563983 RepID=A0A6V7L161_9HYME